MAMGASVAMLRTQTGRWQTRSSHDRNRNCLLRILHVAELLNRMKAALSARPADAMYTLEKRTSKDSTNYKPRTKSQLITTPVDKLPPDVGEPEEIVSRRGFEESRDEDGESDAGDELFLTPFSTPGDDFPFERIMMNRRSGFEAWRKSTDSDRIRQTSLENERELDTESMREAFKQIKEMQLQLEPEARPVAEEEADEEYLTEAIDQPLPESDTEDGQEDVSAEDTLHIKTEAGEAPVKDDLALQVEAEAPSIRVEVTANEAEADFDARHGNKLTIIDVLKPHCLINVNLRLNLLPLHRRLLGKSQPNTLPLL